MISLYFVGDMYRKKVSGIKQRKVTWVIRMLVSRHYGTDRLYQIECLLKYLLITKSIPQIAKKYTGIKLLK